MTWKKTGTFGVTNQILPNIETVPIKIHKTGPVPKKPGLYHENCVEQNPYTSPVLENTMYVLLKTLLCMKYKQQSTGHLQRLSASSIFVSRPKKKQLSLHLVARPVAKQLV